MGVLFGAGVILLSHFLRIDFFVVEFFDKFRRIHLIKQKEYYVEQGLLIKCKQLFFYKFYVLKTLNAFFSKQCFCAWRERFLKFFSTDYLKIFYIYSELWPY